MNESSVIPTVLLIAALILTAIMNSFVKEATGSGLGCVGFGTITLGCWVINAIPIMALVWLIWPKLLLKIKPGTIKDGVDIGALTSVYTTKVRMAAVGLLVTYAVLAITWYSSMR